MLIEVIEQDHYLLGNRFEVKTEYDDFYVFFTGEMDINIKGEPSNSIGIVSKFRTKQVLEYQQKLF